eukprot:TRINITY_DN11097_c0_g1_i1.p1 TRINITY_DN11097_c0_g1~~TRINITY_DN11097_c0_g1_i1.p1  ORF type:complete len:450 (-),score=89.60 TRINITY_DN11097_c0_g1_i1:77-1426(-)
MQPQADNARVIQPMQAAQVVSGQWTGTPFVMEAVGLPQMGVAVDESERQGGEMKRRVLFLSAFIAIYIIVNGLVQCAFDATAMETVLQQIKSVTNFKGGPNLAMIILNSLPGVTTSIVIGLMVPLCGFLGARQNHQGMMGLFCGCNALHCCCGIASLVIMSGVLMTMTAALPGVTEWLEMCDPMQCSADLPEGMDEETKRSRVVDCLAAGTWPEDYKQRFAGPSYPASCPKMLLDCQHELTQGDVIAGALSSEDADGTEEQDSFMKRLRGSWQRRLGINSEEDMSDSLRGWQPSTRWDDRGVTTSLVPMPPDPIASCKPQEKGIKVIHQARLLVPELAPKLIVFIFVKLLMFVPVIFLSCLGFCWGKDLFSRFGQGYGRLNGPAVQQPTQAEMATYFQQTSAMTNLQAPLVSAQYPLVQAVRHEAPQATEPAAEPSSGQSDRVATHAQE